MILESSYPIYQSNSRKIHHTTFCSISQALSTPQLSVAFAVNKENTHLSGIQHGYFTVSGRGLP